MSTWTPIFGRILESSVWCGSTKEVKILWITMLAKKNREGIVESTVPGLAKWACLSIEETVKSLEFLMSPDPWTNTQAFEGRRIEKVEGGWKILNHEFYQREMSKLARQARQRKWVQEKRKSRGPTPRETRFVQAHGDGNDTLADQIASEPPVVGKPLVQVFAEEATPKPVAKKYHP